MSRVLLLACALSGCTKSAPVSSPATGDCPVLPGMPGPGFEVQRADDGTFHATFTGKLLSADDAADQVSVEASDGRVIGFGAYGASLDLAGYQRGELVTVGFDASYSDHTHEPLSIARAAGACPAGVAAYGFLIREGMWGDYDVGFQGEVLGVGPTELVVQSRAAAAPSGVYRIGFRTRDGYLMPGGVDTQQQVTAYFKPEWGQNVVYAIVDADGGVHRPGAPADTGMPW